MPSEFPPNTASGFKLLTDEYRCVNVEFPHLRGITLAQWALESGWGHSGLAINHRNYAGMKWRRGMGCASVIYKANDGATQYCHYETDQEFIDGYWSRFDFMAISYKGWKDHTKDADSFMSFIGPIWVGLKDPNKNKQYVGKVMKIYRNHTKGVFHD